MAFQSITADELHALIARELGQCPTQIRDFFAALAFDPVKWRQSPMGDESGGFWAVAATGDRVLWYNDIEDGFNVSRFVTRGEIPADEYWCNQDDLRMAIVQLMSLSASNP